MLMLTALCPRHTLIAVRSFLGYLKSGDIPEGCPAPSRGSNPLSSSAKPFIFPPTPHGSLSIASQKAYDIATLVGERRAVLRRGRISYGIQLLLMSSIYLRPISCCLDPLEIRSERTLRARSDPSFTSPSAHRMVLSAEGK